jgi:hypothetical protein
LSDGTLPARQSQYQGSVIPTTDRSLSHGEGGGEGVQTIDRAHPLTLFPLPTGEGIGCAARVCIQSALGARTVRTENITTRPTPRNTRIDAIPSRRLPVISVMKLMVSGAAKALTFPEKANSP